MTETTATPSLPRWSSLSPAQRAALTAGADAWRTVAFPDQKIDAIVMTDGSNGARGQSFLGTRSLCLPSGSALGATWNPRLVERLGALLAQEAAAKGAHVLLGPTLNLHRYPLGGRNFENYGEDPLHVARMGVAMIQGLQSRGIAAAVKHFVCNDCEIERETVDALVDEVTLREVYLRPFEDAVRQGRAWALMTAYNKVNGEPCSSNEWLVKNVLKDEWGFDGVVMSDWGGTHSTVRAACGGLDLEMPGPGVFLGATLAAQVEAGHVSQSVVDDKAGRLLLLGHRVDENGHPRTRDRAPTAEDLALLLDAAVDACTLLSNDGTLPDGLRDATRILVTGPAAATPYIQGGGSSHVNPVSNVSVLKGMTESLPSADIRHVIGARNERYTPPIDATLSRTPSGDPGVEVRYYRRNDDGTKTLCGVDCVDRLELTWIGAPHPDIPIGQTIVEVDGILRAPTTGRYEFGLVSAGHTVVLLDGDPVCDSAESPGVGPHFFGRGTQEQRFVATLHEGTDYRLSAVLTCREENSSTAGVILGVVPPDPVDTIEEAVTAARECDAAVVVVGTGPDWEREGADRDCYALPGRQVELIERVAATCPKTVVVVMSGSAVDMSFAPRASAVLWSGFGGEQVGRAIGQVLAGHRTPGGRLPFTVPHADEIMDLGYEGTGGAGQGGSGGLLRYRERVEVGYRWYTSNNLEPVFAFGHGLGYSTITLTNFRLTGPDGGDFAVEIDVTNTGDRIDSAVPQVYWQPAHPARPARLVGFTKLRVEPGARQRVSVPLDHRSFQRWDEARHTFVGQPTGGRLLIGRSSAEVLGALTLPDSPSLRADRDPHEMEHPDGQR